MKRKLTIIALVIMITSLVAGCCVAGETEHTKLLFTNETLQECDPYTFNEIKADKLGLAHDGNFTDEYFELQSFYAETMWNWLCAKYDLMEEDRKLAENDLRFIVRTEYVNTYQQHQSFGTKYFYIRSNIMIENLENAEITKLRGLYKANDMVSDDALQFIDKTWKRVNTENTDYPEDIMCIHSLATGRRIPNCCLIIGIDTMFEVDNNGIMINTEHETEKAEYLSGLASYLEKEIESILDAPVAVIIHQ